MVRMLTMKREPALIIGLLIAILTAVEQGLSTGVTWSAMAPLIVGAITRFFVTPAPSVPRE